MTNPSDFINFFIRQFKKTDFEDGLSVSSVKTANLFPLALPQETSRFSKTKTNCFLPKHSLKVFY